MSRVHENLHSRLAKIDVEVGQLTFEHLYKLTRLLVLEDSMDRTTLCVSACLEGIGCTAVWKSAHTQLRVPVGKASCVFYSSFSHVP